MGNLGELIRNQGTICHWDAVLVVVDVHDD